MVGTIEYHQLRDRYDTSNLGRGYNFRRPVLLTG